MEVALESPIPTYSGGLGVLAGDTLRSAADLGLQLVAVTLVHRRGTFRQHLDANGRQTEAPEVWEPRERLELLEPRVRVEIERRDVELCAWRYRVRGVHGHEVPVYLLDANLPDNRPGDRALTDSLYGGDERYRLSQEVVLGVGGVRMLRALGHRDVDRFHLNEGHAALAVLALVEEELAGCDPGDARELEQAIGAVRSRCVFTTHTPVSAGHDRFSAEAAARVLSRARMRQVEAILGPADLNLTDLALRSASFVNGVAMRHGEVCRKMFPDVPIRSVTNGVHPPTWAAPAFQSLFDRHIEHWREDPMSLREAVSIPCQEIWRAHEDAKRELIETVNREAPVRFELDAFTIGFARRATAYKRSSLVFADPARLEALASSGRPLQFVFAGKAHPHDEEGKGLIQAIFAAAAQLRGRVSVAYLQGYDMALGRTLCAGCDVWLNTPIAPLEASGTSGMKAALNGVPSLSIVDGWWVEGWVEGVTGWAVGGDGDPADLPPAQRDQRDAQALYEKLESTVLPCYYDDPTRFRQIMRNAIALNASFFNTHRMLLQYLYDAYRDAPQAEALDDAYRVDS